MTSIAIIIPVYNEESTIGEILKRVIAVELPWEKHVIVVDDGSSDKTGPLIADFLKTYPEIKHLHHGRNMGKGAAVATGIKNAKTDYIVIQDADLEYDPQDIKKLIAAHNGSSRDVIYGSRLTRPPVLLGKNKTPLLLHYFGNRLLSLATSWLYRVRLTDMETGYKLFPRAAMKKIRLRAKGFELEPEITAKLLKEGYLIREVPIVTKPRGYSEGKKLQTWKDGGRALWALMKYRFVN